MTKMNGEMKANEEPQVDSTVAEKLVKSESGSRNPTGAFPKKMLFYVPIVWTLFQLWIASPLPYLFNVFVLNDTQSRAIFKAEEHFDRLIRSLHELKTKPPDMEALGRATEALLPKNNFTKNWAFVYIQIT
jgi:hypothetical protein